MIRAIRLKPLKRLVVDKRTGMFLTEGGHWTEDATQAFDVCTLNEAVQLCERHGLMHVELLLKFGGGRYDVCLPITS